MVALPPLFVHNGVQVFLREAQRSQAFSCKLIQVVLRCISQTRVQVRAEAFEDDRVCALAVQRDLAFVANDDLVRSDGQEDAPLRIGLSSWPLVDLSLARVLTDMRLRTLLKSRMASNSYTSVLPLLSIVMELGVRLCGSSGSESSSSPLRTGH